MNLKIGEKKTGRLNHWFLLEDLRGRVSFTLFLLPWWLPDGITVNKESYLQYFLYKPSFSRTRDEIYLDPDKIKTRNG